MQGNFYLVLNSVNDLIMINSFHKYKYPFLHEYDIKAFIKVMELIKINTAAKPRTRPFEVLAGSAYDNTVTKQYLRSRDIKSSIQINTRNCKRRKKEETLDLIQILIQNEGLYKDYLNC